VRSPSANFGVEKLVGYARAFPGAHSQRSESLAAGLADIRFALADLLDVVQRLDGRRHALADLELGARFKRFARPAESSTGKVISTSENQKLPFIRNHIVKPFLLPAIFGRKCLGVVPNLTGIDDANIFKAGLKR
jgi:hypothetical protein